MKKIGEQLNLGNILKSVRNVLGITQNELCDEIGIKQHNYSYYENNIYEMPLFALIKISQLVGINVTTLLDFDNYITIPKNRVYVYEQYINNKKYLGMGLRTFEIDDKTTMINIMNNFKKLRVRNNKTIYDMSEYLNCNPTTYSKYENGKLNISSSTFIKLCNFYNIENCDEIIFGRYK